MAEFERVKNASKDPATKAKKIFSIVLFAIIGIFALIVFFRCFYSVNEQRNAVVTQFGKVVKVNTLNQDGKKKRRGMTVGRTAKTKKAVVWLSEDSKDIEIFSGL